MTLNKEALEKACWLLKSLCMWLSRLYWVSTIFFGYLELAAIQIVSSLPLHKGSGNPIAPKMLDLIVVFSAPGKKFL